MQGVEILETQQIATDLEFNWTCFWWITTIIIAIVLIYGILSYLSYRSMSSLVTTIVLGICLGAGLGVLFGEMTSTPSEYETQHKVMIDSEVSMNEFYERYRIINHDGRIFTVRERNHESDN